MYDVREDSFLLRNALNEADPRGEVGVDVGVGTGIITDELSERCDTVIGVDIDVEAVKHCQDRFRDDDSVTVRHSDMFNDIPDRITADIITCNPPYLPSTAGDKSNTAVDGGPSGVEYTERLLRESKPYLADDAEVFFVASDKADLERLHAYLDDQFRYQRLKQTRYFFETLYVYLAHPTNTREYGGTATKS